MKVQARADVHLFLSPSGDLLPRWQEAFPGARGSTPAGAAAPLTGLPPRLVWVRLAQDRPAADQIAGLPEAIRNQPFIVLSDLPEDEEALAVFALGARGYVNTHAAPLVLRRIAAVVQQGGLWIGESLMQRLLRATSTLASAGGLGALAGMAALGGAAPLVPAPLPAAPVPISAPVSPKAGRTRQGADVSSHGSAAESAGGAVAVAELERPEPAAVAASTAKGTAAAPSGASEDTPTWARLLTGRELQVALRVAQGESNKEVARSLGVTERTVKSHLGAVLEKLRVRDRLQLSLLVNGQTQPVFRR